MSDTGFIHLLVPPHLEAELLEPLRRHLASDPRVTVIVERRSSERRPGIDDQVLRYEQFARQERRAQTVPRGLPELPPELERHAGELHIRHRLPAVRSGLEDLRIEQVVQRAREGDPDAHTELIWRTNERVHRRVAMHVKDPSVVDAGVKEVFGHVFDHLDEFDPERSSLEAWLDRKVDERAEHLPRA